jgi:Rad3-related DNA helicase
MILVGPSYGTGYSFDNDLCRANVIGKVPFIEQKNPVVKARCDIDKEYSMYLAMQKLVQGVGRIVRDFSDWGETMIPDDNIGWFLSRYRHLAPKGFSVKPVTGVPPLLRL